MRAFFYSVILIFLLAVTSCGSRSEQSDKSVFRYNESSGIASLDPAFSTNLEKMWACNQLFDGLVALDSALNVVPCIASSWEISDDGLTYDFFIRDSVFFHENECFDSGARIVSAQDFVYSFKRLLTEDLASPGVWVFDPVDLDHSEGFEALTNDHLRIHLKKPFPPFLGMLSMQYCSVLPEEAIRKYGKDFRSNPVGTGPFKFAFWLEDVALVFHKNEKYWEMDDEGQQLPYLDAVQIDFVRDMSSEYLGLLKGSYDFVSGIHESYKDELLDSEGNLNKEHETKLKFQRAPFIKTDYIGILVDDSLDLVRKHPLSDKRLRMAINLAIDRTKMTSLLRNNSVFPAKQGFIPYGLPSFDPNAQYGYDYDPQKALSLIQMVEGDWKDIPKMEISTTSDYVDLCEFIQFELSQVGLDIGINVLQAGAHREQVAKSQLLMFRKSWLADYADAENFLKLFHSDNFCPRGPNYTHFHSEEFDQLFDLSITENDEVKRRKMYRSLDSLVMSEAPIVPLFYDQVSHFISRKIEGFETNPVNMLELKRVKKKN